MSQCHKNIRTALNQININIEKKNKGGRIRKPWQTGYSVQTAEMLCGEVRIKIKMTKRVRNL